jgi:hypothetical protein
VNNQDESKEYINIKGILVGNGVMNFAHNSLERAQIEYLNEHDFIDDRLWNIYSSSCTRDFNSPRCKYFLY